MSFTRPQPVPMTPTLPQGVEVAAYATYLEAQKAVDHLSDQKFPVQDVTIVGTDLKMVERVTGRLTYGRVAVAGAGSGAWFGLFVGLLLSMFGGGGVANGVVFMGIALGAGFGLLFSVLSYALARGRRDFTSQSQIVAAFYAILCAQDSATEARSLLLNSPSGLGRARSGLGAQVPQAPVAPPVQHGQWGAPPAPPQQQQQQPAAPAATRAPDPRWTNPDGTPRYGAMLPTPEQPPAPQPPAQPVVHPVPPAAGPAAAPQAAPPAPQAAPSQQAPPAPSSDQPRPSSDQPSVAPPRDPYAAPRDPYAPPRRDSEEQG